MAKKKIERERIPGSEVLIALLRDKKDFQILQDEGWYRIPVQHTPKRWPPDYVAFYLPKAFKKEAFSIQYYGKVETITKATRRELFPNEIQSANSEKMYHRVQIKELIQRDTPIPSRLNRSVIFVPTTWQKFHDAEELNDLYDDSLLEDILWQELKRRKIPAERQWLVYSEKSNYQLDFALFCNEGDIDVETDGDAWHFKKDRIAIDNERNNDLASLGWSVLRFNTFQIKEKLDEKCLPDIEKSINRYGGLKEDGLVPRKFVHKGGESGQQLSLFGDEADDLIT
jgi:very-short-patch-repair endonuclease